jgi:hypothetical protein
MEYLSSYRTGNTIVTIINKTSNVHINVTLELRLPNHCCPGKTISITHSETVSVALVFQRAKRLRNIMSSVVCLFLPHFSTLFHERHGFGGKSY